MEKEEVCWLKLKEHYVMIIIMFVFAGNCNV